MSRIKDYFGADLVAAISIIAGIWMHQWLATGIIILMLTGGRALEKMTTRRASAVLEALARRVPQQAHRKESTDVRDITVAEVRPGDILLIQPHELCPVDGTVVEGYGRMNEAYLTGEPFEIAKAPGSQVLSGAINHDTTLVIRADKPAHDSRYAKIMQAVKSAEQEAPRIRRIGDRIGAAYAPLALAIAGLVWWLSGDPLRMLSVLLIATPCPLLIAIPIAVIGTLSLAARRGIIVKTPVVLEQIPTCETVIFDKTGTLTYGRPQLTDIALSPDFNRQDVLRWAASLERYSKHPLAGAVLRAAEEQGISLLPVQDLSEKPGSGLTGHIETHSVKITGRSKVSESVPLPSVTSGLECLVFIDERYAAAFRFHDAPRKDSRSFVDHLPLRHRISRVLLVSGDREAEVRYLAQEAGIQDVYASQTPEQKVFIVKAETQKAKTLFVGDGINDAPALIAATVGVAMGHNSDVTSEAADAVILDASLVRVDELLHIARRMRVIALQSALGGMALSLAGMMLAAAGYLPPIAAAITQEIIDVAAILNALRAAIPPKALTDF